VVSELKSTLSLASGRMVAFVATFFIPIVLARLFSPAEFGAYKQLFLIFGTLLIVGQFGMAESLFYFLPRADARAGRYVANTLLFLAIAGAASLALLADEAGAIAAGLNNPELARYLTMLGVFLLLMMLSFVLEIVITARGQYGVAAWTYGLSDVARAAFVVAGALVFRSLDGVLLAAIAFAVIRLGAALVYLVRAFPGGIRPAADCFREQIVYVVPYSIAVLLEFGYRNLHQYAVSSRFDPATFAIYSVGCLQIPVVDALVASAANVLMVRMGAELHAGRSAAAVETWRSGTLRMAAVIFPAVGLLVVLAGDLIVFLFTRAYEASAPIFIVTALGLLPGLLMTDSVLRVYAQTRFLVVINVVRVIAVALALAALLPTFGLVGAALASLVAASVTKVLALARIRRLMGVSASAVLPWKSLGTVAAAAAVSGVVAALAAGVDAPLVVRIALVSTVYVSAYGLLAVWWGVVNATVWRALVSWRPARRKAAPRPGADSALASTGDR
jgi:O-antigen/teichoic acid export membrane protein